MKRGATGYGAGMTEATAFFQDPDTLDDDEDEQTPASAREAVIDPDLPSDLATLKADLAAAVVEEVVLPVPRLADLGYETIHVADIDGRTVENLRRRAKTKTGIDGIKLVALLLAQTNTAIRKNGRRLVAEDGQPYTFSHPDFLEMQQASTAAQACRTFYGRDADMDAASRALLKAAGWGADLEAEVDPEDPRNSRA